MDPTLKRSNTKSIIKTKTKTSHPTETNLDAPRSSKPFYYMSNNWSRLNLYRNEARASQKQIVNPPSKDIHLQARAMTVSADSDISRFLLNKPSKQQPQRKAKESRRTTEASKEELKKSAKGGSVNSLNMGAFDCEEGLDCKKLVFVKDKDVKKDLEHEVKDLKRVSVSFGRRRSFCGSRVELADVLARRSFCGSRVELGDVLASCGVKIVSVDMPPFMQIHAVDCARKTYDSLEKFTAKTLALTLKKEFDEVYGPAWHCIVGTSFGSFVTHSVGGFLYFSMDQKLYILLFKTTVQRAD
ncbi:hypothetical protein AB3S75_029036 [Citrus x aurantiifolia]